MRGSPLPPAGIRPRRGTRAAADVLRRRRGWGRRAGSRGLRGGRRAVPAPGRRRGGGGAFQGGAHLLLPSRISPACRLPRVPGPPPAPPEEEEDRDQHAPGGRRSGARAGRGRARRARARGGPGELRGGQSARPGSARRRREEGPPGAAGGDPPAARPPPAPALGRRWPGRRPACRPSPRSAVAPEVWVWPGGRNVGGGPGEQRAGSRGERGAPLRPRPCSPSRRPSGH